MKLASVLLVALACVVVFVGCVAYPIIAHSDELHGIVIDEQTRRPVSGALVVVGLSSVTYEPFNGARGKNWDHGQQYGISDEDGKFVAPGISALSMRSQIGFESRRPASGIHDLLHPEYQLGSYSKEDPEHVVVKAKPRSFFGPLHLLIRRKYLEEDNGLPFRKADYKQLADLVDGLFKVSQYKSQRDIDLHKELMQRFEKNP